MPDRPQKRAVRSELAKILSNGSFDTSARSREFLRFVVERTLEGRPDSISQRTIAAEVLGRDDQFDPSLDPIVRIQAGRLRRSLERYYLTDGREDPTLIEIPKGTYVPSFRERAALPSADAGGSSGSPRQGWPVVVVVPFADHTGEDDRPSLAPGMRLDLCVELSRYQDIRVVPVPDGNAAVPEARFRITGDLRRENSTLVIRVALTDLATGALIWGERFYGVEQPGFQQRSAGIIAARIAEERGLIHLALSRESPSRPPADATVYDALLSFYRSEQLNTAEAIHEAISALEKATSLDPNCGLAHAMLARLYGTLFSLGCPKDGSTLEETEALAHRLGDRGLVLEPMNQRVRCIRSYLHLVSDNVDTARHDAGVALSLNPNSCCWLDTIGYLLTLSGDWEQGPELIRRAVRLNPCHRQATRYPLWLDAIRRESYQEAHDEALRCRPHGDFWAPLSLATSLALLGRIPEARARVADLLAMRPDFPARGRWLIRRYVKFEDLVDRLVSALSRAGLSTDGSPGRGTPPPRSNRSTVPATN